MPASRYARVTPPLAAFLLVGSAPALAQQASATLDTISVEASRARQPAPGPASGGPLATPVAAPSGTAGAVGVGSATSGGGGGPTGVVGYTARGSAAATKTNTPIIETPASVSVVTREQLNDRNVQTLNEAIAYTPGVSSNVFGFDPRFDAFYIRGFEVTNVGIYRDGLRQPSAPFAIPRVEPYGLDALTILRGPAAGLYGLGAPGGIVDVTSKRPTSVPFGEIWLQRGKYDRYQGAFDLGGPIEQSDGQLSYRLTGLFRQSDSFLPGGREDRNVIAPAITWRPDAETSLTVLAEYLDNTVPGNASFYSNFADPRFQKTNLFSGDPAFQDYTTRQYRVGYALEHRFGPDVVFRQNFRYYNVFGDLRYTQIDTISPDLQTAGRSNGRITNALDTLSLDNQLETRFTTGPVAHTLIGGIDYTNSRYTDRRGFLVVPDLQIGGLIRPNYGAQFIPTPALTGASRQRIEQLGTYVQDQARIGSLILTLTGRHDQVSQLAESYSAPAAAGPTIAHDRAFSYRVGANYLLTDFIVPYASFATTFAPQLGFDRNGAAFQPTTGEQFEAGIKTQMPGRSVFLNMAVFDITQSNVLRPDPVNPILFQAAIGEVRSKGAELELTANLGPGINVLASYSHVDIRTTRNPGAPETVGIPLSGIPANTVTAFANYAFQPDTDLFGLSLGGGIRYAGTSPANEVPGSFRNSTVTLFDAVAAYDFVKADPRLKGMRLQVNVNNAFDRRYFNCQAGACYRGQPRQFFASLIYRW